MGCGSSTKAKEPVRRSTSAPLPQSHAAAAPLRRATSTAAAASEVCSTALLAGDETADAASGAPSASHELVSATLLAGDETADTASGAPGASYFSEALLTGDVANAKELVSASLGSDSLDLEQISTQVLTHCAEIKTGVNGESQEGLRDFVSMLASGAGGAIQVLDSFGPVGPLFKALGVFIQYAEDVQSARGEGQRLKVWAETLIPIIRQSVLMPFPTDMDPSKRQELEQCIEQAIRAIEALHKSIQEVAKSKESWMRFFTANHYIDMMQEAQQRVETAIDIIQKYMIADTKSEVFKITAMLKTVVWGHLTDMQKDVTHLKSNMETGFAEIRAEFKTVSIMLARTCTLSMMHASVCILKATPTYARTHVSI